MVVNTNVAGRPAAVTAWSTKVSAKFHAVVEKPFVAQMSELAQKGEMHLVCTSAFYHLAVAAGLVKKETTKYMYHDAWEVQEKLMLLRDSPAASALDVANAARLCSYLMLCLVERWAT
jgi:hypothetical protein